MSSLLSDLTKDTITLLYNETKKIHNKKKITYMINLLVSIALEKIQPYLYAIMAILVIMFLMNIFQFVYYIKISRNGNNL